MSTPTEKPATLAGTPPKTCREAAAIMREWADRVPYVEERHRNNARAEILEAFGDAPLPESILNEYNWAYAPG